MKLIHFYRFLLLVNSSDENVGDGIDVADFDLENWEREKLSAF